MAKLKFIIVLLFFTQFMFSQLSDFNLSVAATNETCMGNGTITITVSNTTEGATMLFSIYKLPNITTAISVQSSPNLGGLSAGTYRVIATQSNGNGSGAKQQDVVIENQIVTLDYSLTSEDEICSFDGEITVHVVSGTAVQYEIFAGPVIKPLQDSNVFTGLTQGVYHVRIIDGCNQGITKTWTLFKKNTDLEFSLKTPAMASCNTVSIGFMFSKVMEEGVVKYPLQVQTTIFPPSGSPIVANTTVETGTEFTAIYPFYEQQPYSYSFSITDGCGTNYVISGTIQNLSVHIGYLVKPQDCEHKKVTFYGVMALTMVAAPSSYLQNLPIDFTSQIEFFEITIEDLTAGTYVFNATNICGETETITVIVSIDGMYDPYILLFNQLCQSSSVMIFGIQQLILQSCPPEFSTSLPTDYTYLINSADYATFVNLPLGIYTFSIMDLCGVIKPLVVNITPTSVAPNVAVLEGCADNLGSLQVSGQLQSIYLTAAPNAFPVALPHDYIGNLVGGKLTLSDLPPGNYTFEIVDLCQNNYTITATILGYSDNTTVDVQPNCASFNLGLHHTSTNLDGNTKFWLQKFNSVTNSWEHPFSGIAYTDGSLLNETNSFLLQNNATTYNLATLGDFRILKSYKIFSESSAETNCIRILNEFEFKGVPKIENIRSIFCGNTYEVIVTAVGSNPLSYRIVSKNGEPFSVENGNSGFFTGLEAAIYIFEVEDGCHNTVNSVFEVLNPEPFEITVNSFCNGEEAILNVPNFDFLQYQWWRNNDTSTILSTSNTLIFSSFNSNIHNGNYSVRISYPDNPNSCINQILTYSLNVNQVEPNAGQGGNFSYCGNQEIIDLNTLLQGNFDANGTWTETTSSGTLSGNLWNATNVAFGTYQFIYRVDGICGLFSEAVVVISIKEIPNAPIASSDDVVCETYDLNLYASTIPNAIYNWVGTNGFSSSEQNPVIENISVSDNGIYAVNVVVNGCPSGNSSVGILVNELPEFELFQNCINNEYVLSYEIQNNDAAVESDYDFSWFGPDNFSSNESQIVITRSNTGIYGLTITDENGCSATKEINVMRTICEIPNVITPNNDGSNDNLDLTGFGVKKIEIYNRWGRLVYNKENYINEWHGQNNNGSQLPDSTYYYLIQTEGVGTKVGWIFVTKG